MKSFKAFFALLLFVFGCLGVFAQTDTKATLMGKVVDETGAPLPGVTVVLTNVDTGYKRSVVTNEEGRFRAPYIPLGKYNVEATLSGFSKYSAKNLVLSLGDVVTLNITLKPESLEETITVTAEAPLIEVNKVDVDSKVGEIYIENLPVIGRDFKDFTLLTPGVVEAAGDRVAGEGTRGIMNNLQIDGAGYNSTFFGEQRGSTRIPFTFSQETIKEFNVITNGYSAQYGDAAGLIINAVTKSGTNDYKGSAWWFKRKNEWMNAYAPNEYIKDLEDRQPPEFDLDQFGFTFSGPIIKDKLFFFFSYDGQRKDMSTLREFDPAPGIDEFRQLFPDIVAANEGWWPQTEDNDVYFLKLDWNINEDHHFTIRFNYQEFEAINGTNNYRTSGITNNGLETDKSLSVVAELTSVLNENMYNTLRVQYAREQRPRYANELNMMEVVIGYYDAVFGQNNFLPNGLDEDTIEIMDDFTWMLGDHTLKAGFRYAHYKYDDYFFRYQGGRISFYGDYYDFINWADGDPNTNPDSFYYYTQAFSPIDGRVKYSSDEYAIYLEDEWQVTDKLFVAGGLRLEGQNNAEMINPNPLLTSVSLPEYTGYAGTYNLQQIPDDTSNIAPRLALTYDIKGDGSQLIRFGAGYFYSRTPALLVANAILTNGINVIRMDFYPGDPLFPVDLYDRIQPGEITPENSRAPDVYVFAPDYENPVTFKTSLSYEAKLNEDWKFGIDLKYTRGYHYERKLDVNLGIRDDNHDGIQDVDADGRLLWDKYNRPNENFDQIIMFKSDAEAKASSVTFRLEKRYSNRWSMFTSVTLSSSYDNDTNERSVSSSSSFPTNPADLMTDWGRSDYYHKLMWKMSFTVDLGWGVKLSGYHRFYSGRPWSAYAGWDVNKDGYYNDRPTLDDGTIEARNTRRQPNFAQTDLRLSKVFRVWKGQTLEFIIDCFNVFDRANRWTTNYNITRSYFGTLNNSTYTPRTVQLGVKYRF